MGMLPPDFVGSLIITFLIVRLQPYISFANYLVSGLYALVPPKDQEVNSLNVPKKSSKNAKTKKTNQEQLQNLELSVQALQLNTLSGAVFFEEFQLLCQFCIIAVAVNVWSEVYTYFREITLTSDTAIWALCSALIMVVFYPMYIQFKAIGLSSAERQLSMFVGILAMTAACFVMYLPEHLQVFDFQFEKAFQILDYRIHSVYVALSGHQNSTEIVFIRAVKHVWYFMFALLAGIFTGMYTVTILRFAKYHAQLVVDKRVSSFQKLVLQFNLFMPLIVSICWIKPLLEDIVVNPNAVVCDIYGLNRDCIASTDGTIVADKVSFINHSTWKQVRLLFVWLSIMLHFMSYRILIQSFLMEPKDKIRSDLEKTDPVSGKGIQEKVIVHNHYLPVILVQYLAPCFMLLFFSILLKRKGEIHLNASNNYESWNTPLTLYQYNKTSGYLTDIKLHPTTFDADDILSILKSLHVYSIFTPMVYQSIFGFYIFWCNATWSIIRLACVNYWNFFPKRQSTKLD